MADLRKVGGTTPQAVIYKSESNKLHQAFQVKKGDVIVKGQPVKLNTDGTISPYTGESTDMYLGIAVNYSAHPAYPPMDSGLVEVTVMVEGFCIVHGIAGENITTTGFVKTTGGLDDEGIYTKYTPSTSNAETKFLALNTADKDDLVQILVK